MAAVPASGLLSGGAQTIEVKASHLSLISHPEEITRLILKADARRLR